MRQIGVFLAALMICACAPKAQTIPGTKIPDNQVNRDIIEVIEQYRLAVERRDPAALLLMASEQYWEDGGTPTGSDDYGYDGLRNVLTTRFQQVSDVRYSLRYVGVQRRCRPGGDPETNSGCRAYVDVLIDASFTIVNAYGEPMRPDMRDQNQLVLEWSPEVERWLFLSGM